MIHQRRTPLPLYLALLALLACWLGAGSEPAQARRGRVSKERRQARKLVKAGVEKLREGDYVRALSLFKKAHGIYPSPKIQFNIGQTYKELGRYLRAIAAYEKFLADVDATVPPALLKLARERISDLMRRIARLRLQVSPAGATISVDGEERGEAPLSGTIRLMPGPHSVVVRKPGFVTEVLNLRLQPGQKITHRVTLRKPRPKVVDRVVREVYKTVEKPKRGLPMLWTGVAITAAAGITAAVLGGLALREEVIVHDTDRAYSDRLAAASRGKSYQWATDGLLVGAGLLAAGVLTWYLVVVRPSGGTERVRVETPPPVTVVPSAGPGGAGVDVTLRF